MNVFETSTVETCSSGLLRDTRLERGSLSHVKFGIHSTQGTNSGDGLNVTVEEII
jgi:hypothetical protein